MSPNEIATRAAEKVFETIERTKRINKREIAEAIEGVLLVHQMHNTALCADRPSLSADGGPMLVCWGQWLDCGND